MRENRKIKTIEQGFLVFSEMVHNFHIQVLVLGKKGIFYNEEKYKKKIEYKMKNIFDQMNRLFEKEEKIQLLEELKRIEKIVMERYLQSGNYIGERTLEKDFKVLAWGTCLDYCGDLIIKLERIKKKELETTKIENIQIKVAIRMYVSTKKKVKEHCKNTVMKEKAITNRMKKKKGCFKENIEGKPFFINKIQG